MSMKLRAVIVADVEFKDLATAAEFEEILQTYVAKIKNHADPDWSVSRGDDMQIDQVQAAIPMQERRGETGSLHQIVFRGTRGKYKTRTFPKRKKDLNAD
jgi:hypothetical protein